MTANDQVRTLTTQPMHWLNEPPVWEMCDGVMSINTPPNTDLWRETLHGFTADNTPFFYTTIEGAFEATVRLRGDYASLYDQNGLALRIDERCWLKAGVEFVEGVLNMSVVVTHGQSDWSMTSLPNIPSAVLLRIVRHHDSVEVFAMPDEVGRTSPAPMLRLAPFPGNVPVMVGPYAAAPKGHGFTATFEDFQVKLGIANENHH